MWLKSEIGGVQKKPKTDMETPTPPFKHNTTWCTKNKDGRTRNISGGEKKSCQRQTAEERERKDSEWTMKEAVLWQTQTADLENGTICFCLAPVYHKSVLRLRREKLHELSPKTRRPLDWKGERSSQKCLSSLKPLWCLILCLWISVFGPYIVSLTCKANLIAVC